MTRKTALVLVMLTLSIPSLGRAADSRLRLEILVDGHSLPQLEARGAAYVQALRGREFSVRIENLDSRRVGVALSVDGRNTIDATHASARDARKWILDVGESIVLDGWQVSGSQARHFFFTTEDRSYAAWLGDASNAGVIEAVAFRERPTEAVTFSTGSHVVFPDGTQDASREAAATGIGRDVDHVVETVAFDQESSPSSSARVRYGYHDELVGLGVLPQAPTHAPARRERASGFTAGFCPSP